MDKRCDVGVRFQVLGPLRARRGDTDVDLGSVQQQVVLAVLLLQAGRAMGRQQLIDAVWGQDAPGYAVNLLQKHVSALRRVLEPDRPAGDPSRLLTWTRQGYLLSVEPAALDVLVFDHAVNTARAARAAGDAAGAAEALHRGLGLWRGSACEGLASPLLDAERDRLAERRVAALEDRVEVDLALGGHFEVIAELQRLVVDYPLRERLRGQLMLALYRCGRLPEALTVFRRARQFLRDELGVEPGRQLQDLHRKMLASDPGLQPRSADIHELPTPVPAGAPPLLAVWNLPARNPRFTGRGQLLEDLHRLLLGGGDTLVVVALFGLGGVGKTQLAIEYAHRHHVDYDVAWWIDAEQPALIPHQMIDLGHRLGVRVGPPGEDTVHQVLAELGRRSRWLLIFDNAERPDEIADYRPAGAGHVLVTSRFPGWGAMGGRVEVDVLTRRETVAFLRARIPDIRSEVADELAAELGDLPLAAAQAAAYLEQTGLPPADYLRRFRKRRSDFLARGDVLGYHGRLDTTWDLSLERLNTDNRAGVALLELSAFLAPEPIPISLFTRRPDLLDEPLRSSAADADAFSDALGAAVGFSLARRQGNTFQLHRLVQMVIRHRIPAAEQDRIGATVVALVAAAHPGDPNDPAHWMSYARLSPHVLATGPLGDAHPANRKLMLATASSYVREDAQTRRLIAQEMLDRWRRVLGADHQDTLTVAAHLTSALTWLAETEQAKHLGQDTLQRARRVLGPENPVTLRVASSLTFALTWLGETDQACRLGEDTLQRCGQVFGSDSPETLRVAVNLSFAHAWQGHTVRAQALAEESLRKGRFTLGADHPTTLAVALIAATQSALAWPADPSSQRAHGEDTLKRSTHTLGPDHPTTLGLAAHLTFVTAWEGATEQACARGEDTLERSRNRLGAEHLITQIATAVLAFALVSNGNATRAHALGTESLHESRTRFGADHFITLIAATAVTASLLILGDTEQADILGQDTLRRARIRLGPDHPVTQTLVKTLNPLPTNGQRCQ